MTDTPTWARCNASTVSRIIGKLPNTTRSTWQSAGRKGPTPGRWTTGYAVEQLGRDLVVVRYVHQGNPGPDELAHGGTLLRRYGAELRAHGYTVQVQDHRNGQPTLQVRKETTT